MLHKFLGTESQCNYNFSFFLDGFQPEILSKYESFGNTKQIKTRK